MRQIIFLTLLISFFSCNSKKEEEETFPPSAKEYFTGTLQGQKFSGEFATDLGIPNGTKLGRTVLIDFSKTLQTLWLNKPQKRNKSEIQKLGQQLTAEYNTKEKTYTSIQAYSGHINDVINTIKANIDWDIVAKTRCLKPEDVTLVRKFTDSFDGFDLMSCAMTELMPSSDGKLNKDYLDFLLQNAGQEYIEMIPAAYDCEISFGNYQFTPVAYTEVLKMSNAVRNLNLPKDLTLLRGDGHHQAMYLFMLYNMCNFVKCLDKKPDLRLLTPILNTASTEDVLLYCSVAHHLPGPAEKAGIRWLQSKTSKAKVKKNRTKKSKRKKVQTAILPPDTSFAGYCFGALKDYAQKTKNNVRSLK
jgi:hypothetical protein